jgi:hypothetical protein
LDYWRNMNVSWAVSLVVFVSIFSLFLFLLLLLTEF